MPRDPRPMSARLQLDPVADDRYRSTHPSDRRHVFGGLLLGLAVRAAQATVDGGRVVRSMHLSFVAAGRGGAPIAVDVERTRDGQSFATRRLVLREDDLVVAVSTVDFHRPEPGPEHQPPAPPGVPSPDDLVRGRYDTPWFESRDIPVASWPAAPADCRAAWFRPRLELPDDPALHLAALAYVSDHGPTRAAREPHAHLADSARRMSVSLDHALWFHRPVQLDGWVLSTMTPLSTGGGRGTALGALYDQQGRLLASLVQEVLLREL